MKRTFALILLIALSVMAKTGYSQETKVFLSSDKSKISVVKFTKKVIYTSDDSSGTFIGFFDCDTVQRFFVRVKARKYIDKTFANQLVLSKTGEVKVFDSISLRFTHLIGKENSFSGVLKIEGNNINFYLNGPEKIQATDFTLFICYAGFSILLIILMFLYIYFYPAGNLKKPTRESAWLWMFIFIGISTSVAFLLVETEFLDAIFLGVILPSPAFMLLFCFGKRERRRENLLKLKIWDFDVKNPFFDFPDRGWKVFKSHRLEMVFVDKNYEIFDGPFDRLVELQIREGIIYKVQNKKKGKYGLADKNGVVILDVIYDFISKFEDGTAFIKQNDKWGIINDSAEILLLPKYDCCPKKFMGGFKVVEDGEEKTVDAKGDFYDPTNVC